MIREFIDREVETRLLEEEWGRQGGRMIILYGRRRIGKTRLFSEFIRGKEGIMYFAEDTAAPIQIRQLQEKCAQFYNDTLLASLEITSWDQLFTYLAQKPLPDRAYLVIDEFSYLIKNDRSVLSALQKAWDTAFSGSQWCILLCGSMLGLMSELALSSTSPLYGRRTRDILLEGLAFRDARKFVSSPFADALKTYLAIGGVPEYLLKAGEYRSFAAFVAEEFFSKYGYFYREPYFLLSQEFRELRIYQSILNAIAEGNTAPGTIAQFCGIDASQVHPYLENMIRLGIVEKELPMLVKTRRGLYRIKDPIFNFWYTHIFPNRQLIETGTLREEMVDMDPYFGRQFEMFARKEFVPAVLPGYRVGRWWYRENEIDVVATDDRAGSVVFGECKWGILGRREAATILRRLEGKARLVRHDRYPDERFMLIAREIEGKEELREDGFLPYDWGDIERVC